jgi:hypothetical protein
VSEVSDLNAVPSSEIPVGTSTFGADWRQEEVFNPYKTNPTATMPKLETPTSLDFLQVDQVIAENFELRQQLNAVGPQRNAGPHMARL